MKNKLTPKWLIYSIITNPLLRLRLSLFLGIIINFFYIAGNLSSAIIDRNIWSACLTFYHGLFLLIRFALILSERGCDTEQRIKNVCFSVGIVLLFLDLAAGGVMIYSVQGKKVVTYSGMTLLGFLIYTAYSLTVSVIGMKKYANDNQPLHFVAKNMTLTSALMSVFNLQYSILVTIGASYRIINKTIALLGFTIFFLIVLLAVRLVYKNAPRSSKICRNSYNAYSGEEDKFHRKTNKEK